MEEKELRNNNAEEKKETVAVIPTKKENKRSKKRLFLLLLLLIVTGLLLSTSTYAWFTSNRTVTVNDINVDVVASGGIQISVDGTSWKSVISNADIAGAINTYAAATNQMPSALKPVSTALKTLDANGYLSMWLGTVKSNTGGDYILTTEDVSTVTDNSASATNSGANGSFVMFDLFLRLDSSEAGAVPLYLTTSSDVTATTDTTDIGTKNASRVAFIVEGEADTGATVQTIQALKTTDTGNIYLWEPNYDVHTASGIANATSFYTAALTPANDGQVVPYDGTIGEVTEANNVLLSQATATAKPTQFASVTPTYTTKAGWRTGTEYLEIFNLNPNKVTKVRVYFWVEGQDIDCENNASGGKITLSLQFSLNESAE